MSISQVNDGQTDIGGGRKLEDPLNYDTIRQTSAVALLWRFFPRVDPSVYTRLRPQGAGSRAPPRSRTTSSSHMTHNPRPDTWNTTAGLKVHLILLLSRLALHAPQSLRLVLNGLVDLGAARGLVAVNLGSQGGVVLPGDLLLGLLLAATVLRVVLVLGGREAVGYAAPVLCVGAEQWSA